MKHYVAAAQLIQTAGVDLQSTQMANQILNTFQENIQAQFEIELTNFERGKHVGFKGQDWFNFVKNVKNGNFGIVVTDERKYNRVLTAYQGFIDKYKSLGKTQELTENQKGAIEFMEDAIKDLKRNYKEIMLDVK